MGRDVWRVVVGVTIAVISIVLVAVPMVRARNAFSPVRRPLLVHEHYSLEHRDLKHYTLPKFASDVDVNGNQTVEMEEMFKFFNSSRGIVRCSHFESEIGCSDLYNAFVILNETFRKKKFLVAELPSSLEAAVDALHAAFLVSIASKRRLYVSKSPFALPEMIMNKAKLKTAIFSASQFDRCELEPLISSKLRGITMKGRFRVVDLLLAPNVFEKIPQPFRTHGLFLLSRWLNMIPELEFPANQLQIGIALEFRPDKTAFGELLERLSEGYTNVSLNIWCPGQCDIPEIRGYYVKTIRKFEEAVTLLAQCDKYVGSLGFFSSHLIARLRGRGGMFIDPRDTMVVETSNSQSGMLFLMKHWKTSSLMCPKGANALQNFLMFHAL